MTHLTRNGRKSVQFVCTLLFIVSLIGCSSSRKMTVPAELFAEARKAAAQAEQVGAREFAPLELRNANKKLEEAQVVAREKKGGKRAMQLVQQALVDAELAEMKSLSAKAQSAVDELHESIRTLREEFERKAGQGQKF